LLAAAANDSPADGTPNRKALRRNRNKARVHQSAPGPGWAIPVQFRAEFVPKTRAALQAIRAEQPDRGQFLLKPSLAREFRRGSRLLRPARSTNARCPHR